MQKQGFNGAQGEDRTRQILGKYFIYNKKSVDEDGVDFEVQLFPENGRFGNYDKIEVRARVQAKFFENNNEVKIAKEYVEDTEGLRTDFFALLHTDIDGKEICFFFTSKDIKEKLKIRPDKKTRKEYYVFSLSKNNQFEEFRGYSKNEINQKIEEGIRNTEEYRNQKYIQEIGNKYTNPVKTIFENNNRQLFKEIAGKHIVDKLYIALNSFSNFRRITSWRLIDKITFKEINRTTTYYYQFYLHTDNDSILSFFNNLDISEKVTIKNLKIFGGVAEPEKKANKIIDILNNNLIFWVSNSRNDESSKIIKEKKAKCNCLDCQLSRFEYYNINGVFSGNHKLNSNLWDLLQKAYILSNLGKYEESKDLLSEISQKAKNEKNEVVYFIAKYNLRSIAFKTWSEEYPDVERELQMLALSDEKRHVLSIVANNSFFNDYANSIKSICLKIKDYNQRSVVNNTYKLTFELKAKLAEYQNFIEGNWFITSYEFDKVIEEAIECCIISFSMKTEHSHHLDYLDDYWVELAIHYCEPYKLLSFFQRNNVKLISYISDRNYFKNILSSFYDKRNIEYLCDEIKYIDGKTKNHYLRRKIEKTFENICVLLGYLDFDKVPSGLLKSIIYFIKKIDLDVHYLSLLAHPFFKKSELFESEDLFDLVRVLVSNEKYLNGYLITNVLLVLNERGFKIKPTQKKIIEILTNAIISNPSYNLLKVVPYILPKKQKDNLLLTIRLSLEEKFKPDLYYEAVLNNCIENPNKLFNVYLDYHKEILKLKDDGISFFGGSPYTNISERANSFIRKIVVLYIYINNSKLLEHPLLVELTQIHPYFKFILNIDSFNLQDNFDINWVLENQSTVVIKKMASNKYIAEIIKDELRKKYNREIAKIYFMYF